MAWTNAKELTDELQVAVSSYDEPTAARTCDEITKQARREDRPFPFDEAKRALDLLRGVRMFALMERLADTFILSGQNQPRIRRQYAQALLDQGRLSSAVSVLERLIADTARAKSYEHAEARGLLGRTYKQMYLDGHSQSRRQGRRILEQAVRCYYDVYRQAPSDRLWHGVNAAALLQRAERDDIRLKGFPKPAVLAEDVLKRVKAVDAKGKADHWAFATALEAAVGLGLEAEAKAWLQRYLTYEGITAFQLSSARRQLMELWQLVPDRGLGADILPVLETRLLACPGCQVDLQAAAVGLKLEKVLGDTTYVNIHWYRRGLERCARVARVETELNPDEGFGTAFLVRGHDLKDSLGSRAFLMTNFHVVNRNGAGGALRPGQARVSFKANGGDGRQWRVKDVYQESPPEQLDCSLLELEDGVDDSAAAYPLAPALPVLDDGPRVYIIGHPKGGTLSFSLNDNQLLDYDDRLLHYRAPTEGGSSGSPVFNQDWELVGLHHGGGRDLPRLHSKDGRYAANEGIYIDAIRKWIP
jgi:trypsin-like peptidase/tetratricopeptide repeat protein